MAFVSILMPVYNCGKYLRKAIESILCQTFTDFEFIIVDDGSEDDTVAIVESYTDTRIHFLRNPGNLGIVETLNTGLSRAHGTYICRMDADDIAVPRRIETQVKFLEAHPGVGMAGSQVQIIDAAGLEGEIEEYPQTNARIRRALFVHNPFAHSSVMIRRSVLDAVGTYDKRFKHNEDYDLWLRVAARYEVANLPEVLLKRRVHSESITGAKETALSGYRVKTLSHAALAYYRNPLLIAYLVRPAGAYVYRAFRDLFTR